MPGQTTEEQWQNRVWNLCGNVLARRALWNKLFGTDWKQYNCPSHIKTLVTDAATEFIALAAEITSRPEPEETPKTGAVLAATRADARRADAPYIRACASPSCVYSSPCPVLGRASTEGRRLAARAQMGRFPLLDHQGWQRCAALL